MNIVRKAAMAALAITLLASAASPAVAAAQTSSLTPQQAQKIAVDAYIYGYSLVTSEITRMATTNTVAANMKTLQAPMGQIISLPGYPPATYKGVTAPNADTLYSFGFFDISKQPWVFSYPNMGTRYFVFPIYDEWTNVIGAPGARTYGYGAQSVAITGPGWHGTLPSGVTQQIKSPTGIIFTIGRVYAQDTPQDLAAVHALQAQFKWVPLSSFGKPYTPQPGKAGGPYTPAQKVRDIIDSMNTSQYFNFMATTMAVSPPILPQDATIVAEMSKIGLVPGKPFDMSKLSPQTQSALSNVASLAFAKIAALQKSAGKVVNNWVIPGASGSYGSDYLLRAYTSAFGWGANLSLDANYPNTKVDSQGNPLVGTNTYRIHFAKGATPPVNGFWSITMYDKEYFFYPNPLNKLTVSLRNHPKFNADGSLDLYFANVQPANVPQANWLPAPKGNFILMMRMYWPKASPPSILPPSNPTWVPPPVTKMK
jgi:hypothetical protein